MANPEHVNLLRNGVDCWNSFQSRSPDLVPDLGTAKLRGLPLGGAILTGAFLRGAQLEGVDLSGTSLQGADLRGADLRYASCRGADLHSANLSGANLKGADFQGASFLGSIIRGADVRDADMRGSKLGWTVLASLDLSRTKGLSQVKHFGPSTVGVDTLSASAGAVPEEFLEGCGFSKWEISASRLYDHGFTGEEFIRMAAKTAAAERRKNSPGPIFISYSHKDQDFVEVLEERLAQAGLPVWRDHRHLNAGPLRRQIETAMRTAWVVLLVLSENSVENEWVEWEIDTANALEKEFDRDLLCPLALDDSWQLASLPPTIQKQIGKYVVLDFSDWKSTDRFAASFSKLEKGFSDSYAS